MQAMTEAMTEALMEALTGALMEADAVSRKDASRQCTGQLFWWTFGSRALTETEALRTRQIFF
jgi:hypothetical protein